MLLLNIAGLFGDTLACHLASSICAGFCSTVCGSPFDVVKSRMMSELAAACAPQQATHGPPLDCSDWCSYGC